jgi:MFS family permease
MSGSATTNPRAHWLPYIVAATFFMEYLDTTVIATALPQMAASFKVGPNEVSLGMTAYMLALAVFIPVSGWVADRFGSRSVFATAIVVFTLASILCGLSQSVGQFTAARILQGIGDAMMVPVGRLIVVRNTEKKPADASHLHHHLAGDCGTGAGPADRRLHHDLRVLALDLPAERAVRDRCPDSRDGDRAK